MRKIRQVSFNLEDIYESKLHDYALEQNKFFSKYVKSLIEKDRNGVPVKAQTVAVVEQLDDKKKRSKVSAFL